jgi:hypothetical protein
METPEATGPLARVGPAPIRLVTASSCLENVGGLMSNGEAEANAGEWSTPTSVTAERLDDRSS